jgi:hypothetical protein
VVFATEGAVVGLSLLVQELARATFRRERFFRAR